MRKYKFLPHTADVRMKVEADSIPELFVGAMEGMARILKSSKFKVESSKLRKGIKISAQGVTPLLIDFLSAVLTQSQIEKAVFYEAQFEKLNPSTSSGQAELEAETIGAKVDGFDEDIKAVTYHGAEVAKNKEGNYEVTVLFDI